MPRGPRATERARTAPGYVPRQARRCATCARVRPYEAEDRFCFVCGSDALEAACECGRAYDYALAEPGTELWCPRCGKGLAGRVDGFEA